MFQLLQQTIDFFLLHGNRFFHDYNVVEIIAELPAEPRQLGEFISSTNFLEDVDSSESNTDFHEIHICRSHDNALLLACREILKNSPNPINLSLINPKGVEELSLEVSIDKVTLIKAPDGCEEIEGPDKESFNQAAEDYRAVTQKEMIELHNERMSVDSDPNNMLPGYCLEMKWKLSNTVAALTNLINEPKIDIIKAYQMVKGIENIKEIHLKQSIMEKIEEANVSNETEFNEVLDDVSECGKEVNKCGNRFELEENRDNESIYHKLMYKTNELLTKIYIKGRRSGEAWNMLDSVKHWVLFKKSETDFNGSMIHLTHQITYDSYLRQSKDFIKNFFSRNP